MSPRHLTRRRRGHMGIPRTCRRTACPERSDEWRRGESHMGPIRPITSADQPGIRLAESRCKPVKLAVASSRRDVQVLIDTDRSVSWQHSETIYPFWNFSPQKTWVPGSRIIIQMKEIIETLIRILEFSKLRKQLPTLNMYTVTLDNVFNDYKRIAHYH